MSTTDLPGSSLLAGRYRLVERLGAGGMSVVWRGFDEVLGRQVAVKVLPPSTSADPSFRRRLRAEAQAAARLSHPHITNVYDYGEATTVDGEAVPYVVMELVEGESLAAVLGRERRLPWTAAVRICAQVAAALAAAHARGIVHRDVTPANVMLTPSGAKVVDFGISALIGENDIDPDGSLMGTPAYLAPERLVGGQVSPATDVYAVGLLIYRTLIGQLPWDVGTTTALLRAHQYTEPEPLPPVDGLPPAVAALVARCLEKSPDDRPSSAEAAHVLAGISTGDPAGLAFVAAWLDSGEDTTILPSQLNTDVIARVKPGHARFAGAAPVHASAPVGDAAPDSAPAGARSEAGDRAVDAPPHVAVGRAVPAQRSAASPDPAMEPVDGAPQVRLAGRLAGRAHVAAPSAPAPGPVAGRRPDAQAQAAASPPQLCADADDRGLAAEPRGGSAPGHRQPAFGGHDSPAHGSAYPPSLSGHAPAGRVAPATGPGPSVAAPRNSRFAPPARPAASPAGPVAAGPAGANPVAAGPVAAPPADRPQERQAVLERADVAAPTAAAPVATIRPAAGVFEKPGSGRNVRTGSSRAAPPTGTAVPMASPPGGRPPQRPGAGPAGARGPDGTSRRRVFLILGAVLAVGAAGYAWRATDPGRDGASTPPGEQLLVQQGPRKCIVTYSVRSDTGRTFQAGLTVTNLTGAPVSDWVLRFVMPGDQTVSTIGKLKPRQEQHDVVVRSTKPIRPNSTAVMDVTGGYRTSNEVPVAFSLKGETCDVFVSGKPGDPSRPVQRLVGGGTRLGPVPPAGVALPGLTASPGGVIATIPVVGTGTAGSASPTRTSPPPPNPRDVPTSSATVTSSASPFSPPPDLPDPSTTSPAAEVTTTEPVVDDGGGVVIVPPGPLP